MKLWNLLAAAMSLMWFTIVSRPSMLRVPGASFWSKAELMTHLKIATTALSLLESEIIWAFELIAYVIDHVIQLVKVLILKANDISQ